MIKHAPPRNGHEPQNVILLYNNLVFFGKFKNFAEFGVVSSHNVNVSYQKNTNVLHKMKATQKDHLFLIFVHFLTLR